MVEQHVGELILEVEELEERIVPQFLWVDDDD